jgi:hypothetical protein
MGTVSSAKAVFTIAKARGKGEKEEKRQSGGKKLRKRDERSRKYAELHSLSIKLSVE